MADNTILNSGTGGDTIGTDDVGGIKYQLVKVAYGLDGAVTRVTATTTLPVDAGAGALLLASTATIGTTTVALGGSTGAFPAYFLASTPTIGGVNALLVASSATIGTVTIIQPVSPSAYLAQLIASTPTIGAVTQAGGWDMRLIASTSTAGTVTVVQAGGNSGGAWPVQLLASTPTIGGVNAILAASTATIGTVTCVQGGSSGAWPVYLLASTPTIGGVNALLVASTATVGTVTSVCEFMTRTSEAATVTNATSIQAVCDVAGKQINLPYSNPENMFATTSSTTGSARVQLVATATGVLRNYITCLVISNTSATGIKITMNDGSVNTWVIPAPATSGAIVPLLTPLRGSPATAWNYTPSGAASTIDISAVGYTGV